jgi:hypothetical protein
MNICNTAALALVMWYLVLPPIEKVSVGEHVNINAPPAQWWKKASFASEAECRKFLSPITPREDAAARGEVSLGRTAELLAKCVASDDPRLKRTTG